MITFVYTYYDNPSMLQRQLAEWLSYPAEALRKLKFTIVDDGSQRQPAHPVVQSVMQGQWGKLNLQLFRINVNIPWNMDGARNLAMSNLKTDWALLCDIDHLLPADQLPALFALPFSKRTAYQPNQLLVDGTDLARPHPNTYIMRKDAFWHVGGYDEDFAGWYGSDANFRRLMQEWGITLQYVPSINLVVFKETDIDDANTKDWGRNHSRWSAGQNPTLKAKAHSAPYKPVNPLRFPWERLI